MDLYQAKLIVGSYEELISENPGLIKKEELYEALKYVLNYYKDFYKFSYPCTIESADFGDDTVTLKMAPGYRVSAGPYLLCEVWEDQS